MIKGEYEKAIRLGEEDRGVVTLVITEAMRYMGGIDNNCGRIVCCYPCHCVTSLF